MANYPLLSFSSGELSPQIDARSDVDKYRSGCRTLENMIPRIYGPATRRPGTKYIETCNGVARVMPFIYSNTIAYILLFEDLRLWFYRDGGQVLGVDGRRYGIDSPYLAADLFELQYKQSNDVMWICHNAYAPRKLTRTTASSFSLDAITFVKGPFMKRNDLENDDGVTMTPSVTTGTGTLTASSATFDTGHIGALFAITQPRVNFKISGDLTSTGVLGGSSILTEGPCTLNISDGWSGTVELQRSTDSGVTWETRRSFYSSDGKRAVQYTFNEEEDNVLHRVYVSSYNATYTEQVSSFDEDGYDGEVSISKTSTISGDLTVDSSTQTGRCRITGFVSSTSVTMTVLKDFASTNADERWYEGSWSTYRGFPKCVTFFKERCVYAATTYQPQTLWLSAVDNFENFDTLKNNADDAFSLTLSSDTRNGIQWITGMESLLVGTTGGEWRIYAETDAFSKTNFELREQTQRGSKELQALPCGDVVLFVDFVGRKVRELTFDGNTKYKYISPDLCALSEHITESGIDGMAFQRNPDPILWSFRDDGTLLSMTYEREQNVIGWARHPFLLGREIVENGITGSVITQQYPTLQVADGTFATQQTDPSLDHTIPIANVTDLQNMNNNLTWNYYLTGDIDASATSTWNGGAGFIPIGSVSDKFSGTFDGNGYTITGLVVNRPTEAYCGLFGEIDPTGGSANCVIANVTLKDASITGRGGGCFLGIINGDATYKTVVQNCHVSGTSSFTQSGTGGINYCGGFAGDINGNSSASTTEIMDCTCVASVDTSSGGDDTGGFVGHTATNVTYTNCRAFGDVDHGTGYNAGGFFGSAEDNADFIDCTARGDITADEALGGFFGTISNGTVTFTRCSSRGDVIAANPAGANTGGFGSISSSTSPSFTDCYSWGNITISAGGGTVGGFVATNDTPSAVFSHCYSIGSITDNSGEASTGGFMGYDSGPGTITNSFWDTEASAENTSEGSTPVGHITSWMQTQSNFENAGWDFDTIWLGETVTTWDYSSDGLGCNSVAVIPSSSEDEVWVVVTRIINGSTVRYLEQMQPRDWSAGTNDDTDQWFVDSGLDYDSTATTSFSGLDHLEGEEVAILADGAVVANQTVTSGAVTIPVAASRVIIGLPIRYKLKPMRIDFTSGGHTTQTQVKRIGEVGISFYKSAMVEYGKAADVANGTLLKLNWRTTEEYDTPLDLFTGDVIANPEGGFDRNDDLLITGNAPVNCTVRALLVRVDPTGR